MHACRETIQELTTTLKPVPHHVVEDMVFIVDPLGDVIRISMIYGLKYEVLRENLVSHFDYEHFARIYTASSRRTIQKVGLEAVISKMDSTTYCTPLRASSRSYHPQVWSSSQE